MRPEPPRLTARHRLSLTVGRVPEVLVKVSGGGRNAGAIKAHLNYISRGGRLSLEDEAGALAQGRDEIVEALTSWSRSHCGIPTTGDYGKQAHNIILSMPPGTSREGVREAARAFAAAEFGHNHQYLFTEHRDEAHPHVHLVVKAIGRDGVRLSPRKADLQRWREHFADALRAQGILANATPRRARGVVRRAPQQSLLHMQARGNARVDAGGTPPTLLLSPEVDSAYRNVQAALAASGSAQDRQLAAQIEQFAGERLRVEKDAKRQPIGGGRE
jgi:hypothetical protein